MRYSLPGGARCSFSWLLNFSSWWYTKPFNATPAEKLTRDYTHVKPVHTNHFIIMKLSLFKTLSLTYLFLKCIDLSVNISLQLQFLSHYKTPLSTSESVFCHVQWKTVSFLLRWCVITIFCLINLLFHMYIVQYLH